MRIIWTARYQGMMSSSMIENEMAKTSQNWTDGFRSSALDRAWIVGDGFGCVSLGIGISTSTDES